MAASAVDVSRREIVQALVIAPMIIVLDEASDMSSEIAGQIVVLQQNAVLERLTPALDLALGLGMMGRATNMSHSAICEPFAERLIGSSQRSSPWTKMFMHALLDWPGSLSSGLFFCRLSSATLAWPTAIERRYP